MAEKGYIKISRRFFEHRYWNEPREYSRAEAWLDLIQSARFDSSIIILNSREIEVRRGEVVASRRYLEHRWGWGSTKVINFIDNLKENQMITTKQTSGQTILTLCNYDDYNDRQTIEQTRGKPATNQRQTSDKPKIIKEKKVNNKYRSTSTSLSEAIPTPIDYDLLVDFFNTETKGTFGTLRKPLTDKRKTMVGARIKEQGNSAFAEVVHKSVNSDFLRGQNNRGWTLTFDWMIKPTNFEKILTGNYDNNGTNKSTKSGSPDPEDLMRAVAEGISRARTPQEWEL